MEERKQFDYIIHFKIKGELLNIPFGSYNDYSLLGKNELEDFIIYLIKRCVNIQTFINENENALFVSNIHLWKVNEKKAFYSIERSVQLHP